MDGRNLEIMYGMQVFPVPHGVMLSYTWVVVVASRSGGLSVRWDCAVSVDGGRRGCWSGLWGCGCCCSRRGRGGWWRAGHLSWASVGRGQGREVPPVLGVGDGLLHFHWGCRGVGSSSSSSRRRRRRWWWWSHGSRLGRGLRGRVEKSHLEYRVEAGGPPGVQPGRPEDVGDVDWGQVSAVAHPAELLARTCSRQSWLFHKSRENTGKSPIIVVRDLMYSPFGGVIQLALGLVEN